MRQCKGEQRASFRKNLKTSTPSEVYLTEVANMTNVDCEAGNLTSCQSRDVLKVISLERNRSDKLHDDLFMELVTAMYLFRDVDTTSNTSIGYIYSVLSI